MENKLFAYFDDKPLQAYPIVNGAVYSEEFNETIDSFEIIIDNVTDFIDLSRPYHIVKIVNTGVGGISWNGNNYIFMYTDSTLIKKTNIHDDIYCYTIQLMNIIKALENIQCPNLVITHDLVTGQTQTIYDYINKYMTLYCPKIKVVNGDNWEYQYLFNWQGLATAEPFKTLVADMQVNEPTLRELLTSLMIQVDCIPTMNYRELGYINFRKASSNFAYQNNGVNHIDMSNASDSYVNTLVQSPTQVLDNDNVVIEDIGFRDRNKVALKQTENLYLTTRFPIYKIKRVRMYVNKKMGIIYKPNNINSVTTDNTPYCTIGSSADDDLLTGRVLNPLILNNDTLRINFVFNQSTYHKGYIKNLKVHLCAKNPSSVRYEELSVVSFDDWYINYNDNTSNKTVAKTSSNSFVAQRLLADGQLSRVYYGSDEDLDEYPIFYNMYNYFLELPITSNVTHIWVEYDFLDDSDNKNYYCFYPLLYIDRTNYGDISYHDITGVIICHFITGQAPAVDYFDADNPVNPTPTDEFPIFSDVTPLFVEKNKRQLLETDYTAMRNLTSGTIEDLARFYYGTVEYSIGGKEITGFSDTYSFAEGWWQHTLSYLDNIIMYIGENNLVELDTNIPELQEMPFIYANMPVNLNTVKGYQYTFEHYIEKSKYNFEITYYPLNDFKMKWSKKEEFDYPIERLNNLDSGLSAFDRLDKKAQSMVDRIGNPILTITQTTDNFANVQSVNSSYLDYTIFKRVISIERNYFSVTYYASKNYVMQNYFTSITTKYRAYQYVDYGASVVRKENKTIYCLLAKDYYIDGDDNLVMDHPRKLLEGINYYFEQHNLKYVIKTSIDSENSVQTVKNALSVLTYDNGLALCTVDYDNVSAGVYLNSYDVDTGIGGIRQSWQVWEQSIFNEKHYIYYVNLMRLVNVNIGDFTDSNYFPIITDKWEWEPYVDLQISNDKTIADEYVFYKDLAEVINFTLQFEFYTNDSDITWCKNMFKNSPLVQQIKNKPNVVLDLSLSSFICYDKKYAIQSVDRFKILDADIDDYIDIGTNSDNIPYIKVKWGSISSSITAFSISSEFDELSLTTNCIDYIAFKRNGATEDVYYYLSFNDSKSTTARKYLSNGLYNRVKCKKGIDREYEEN